MSESNEGLLAKIADLEQQLIDREAELSLFRQELGFANEKLEVMVRRLKKELHLAQKIQRHLIPTEFPSIPGFEFSSKYIAGLKEGGDYFDIFPHEDKSKFGVIVASCSGYMVSALLLSSLLKVSSLLETKRNPDPTQAAKAIMSELQADMEPGQTVDLLYGIFDRKKFELNYVCFGDVIALHQCSATKDLVPFEKKMPAITRQFDQSLEVGQASLSPRDRLVFATKGAYLVQGQSHEEYGKARLLRSIVSAPAKGVHELRNKICFEIDSYSINKRPNRDMTVVVAEVKDRVIKLA